MPISTAVFHRADVALYQAKQAQSRSVRPGLHAVESN